MDYQQRIENFIVETNSTCNNYVQAIQFAKENGYTLKNDISYNGYIILEKLLSTNEDKIEIKVYDDLIKSCVPCVDVKTKEAIFGSIMDEIKYRFVSTQYHKQWDRDWYDLKDLPTALAYVLRLEVDIIKYFKENIL